MLASLLLLTAAFADSSLVFDGAGDHVAMGPAAGLGLATFTVECWFRWDGAGVEVAGSGSGGLDFHPLVAKGRGESDGGTQDMAWGLGIEEDSGALCADFEDLASGGNHPVVAATDVRDGAWHHAAVTYDGGAWALYLDGALDGAADTGGATPRHDSVQHLAVATAMNTLGEPKGYFLGAIDEVRIWDRALGAAEIAAGLDLPLAVGEGLLARWGFDEGAGTEAADDVGGVTGAVVGATWGEPAPLVDDRPPYDPILRAPEDGAEGVALDPSLAVRVNDPDGDPVSVRFWGRPLVEPGDDFTFVMLPDTQYYCSGDHGGEADMFFAQTSWIVEQREARAIVWVAHVGDIVNDGDSDVAQWPIADEAMALLEDPAATGLPDGIPYSIVAGNHDQTPNGDPLGTTEYYNATFGAERFAGRAYYGGHFGDDNDDHMELFSAGGIDFLVIDLEYDQGCVDQDVLAWADEQLSAYPDRFAIVNAHHLIETDASFSEQGECVYAALSHHDNLFMMLSGHLTAEAWRSDPAGETGTVHTIMADYQFVGDGGAGWLRIFTLSPSAGTLHAETYSPWLDQYDRGADSDFELPWSPPELPWQLLGTVEAAAGDEVELTWTGLEPLTDYEWYVDLSDGLLATEGPVWSFRTGTGEGEGDTGDSAVDTGDGGNPGGENPCGCAGAPGPRGLGLLLLGLGLVGVRRRR
ncbi:MAG: LamG-like jellyroll fold domain-containing protein [Pseudomonadota bacterium]